MRRRIAADKVSGLHLAYALLAALLYRERTGEAPGYVEVPMFELMAAFSLCEHLGAATFEEDGKVGYVRVHLAEPPALQDQGRLGRRAALHGAQLDQGADRDRPRRRGRDAPGSRNATERSRRVDELYDILAEALPSRTTAEWLAIFERLDIPSQPVRLPNDLLSDPHLADVGFFTPNFAQRHAGHAHAAPGHERGRHGEATPTSPPPLLGADTEAVLREAGCSEAEIAELLPQEPKPAAGPQAKKQARSAR